MWVVVKIMVPFWIPIMIRHLIFRVPTPKGITFLTTTHVDAPAARFQEPQSRCLFRLEYYSAVFSSEQARSQLHHVAACHSCAPPPPPPLRRSTRVQRPQFQTLNTNLIPNAQLLHLLPLNTSNPLKAQLLQEVLSARVAPELYSPSSGHPVI